MQKNLTIFAEKYNDFLYRFPICVFFKFQKNLLKILINYLEVEFLNKKIILLMHYLFPSVHSAFYSTWDRLKTISGAFKIKSAQFSGMCGFSDFPSWQHFSQVTPISRVFEIFSHCKCASVLGQNQDCVITIVCTTYVFKVNNTKVS